MSSPIRLKRFALAIAVAAVAAGVVVLAVPAASFDDTGPCVPDVTDRAILVCPSGNIDAPYSVQLKGRDGCDLYTWEVANGALPAGLSMTRRGLISGTPTTSGRAQFWLIIRELRPEDGGHDWCSNVENNSQREHAIDIYPGLVVTTTAAPAGMQSQPYSFALAAAMKSGPEQTAPLSSAPTWSLVEGELPPGLGLDPAGGVISGMPSARGHYSFVVRASVGELSASRSLAIEIAAVPLAITPPPLPPQSEVGVRVGILLEATGGTPPYTWTLVVGELPEGLTLAPTGVLAGRPLQAGRYRFTLAVTDADGQTSSHPGFLNVAPRLAIATSALRPARVGRLYRARIVATGGVMPRRVTLVRGPLPRGVRFLPAQGRLVGAPRVAGRYRLTFRAVDQLGVLATKTYLLRVTPAPARKKKP